jgi:hypothetical protein
MSADVRALLKAKTQVSRRRTSQLAPLRVIIALCSHDSFESLLIQARSALNGSSTHLLPIIIPANCAVHYVRRW